MCLYNRAGSASNVGAMRVYFTEVSNDKNVKVL